MAPTLYHPMLVKVWPSDLGGRSIRHSATRSRCTGSIRHKVWEKYWLVLTKILYKLAFGAQSDGPVTERLMLKSESGLTIRIGPRPDRIEVDEFVRYAPSVLL